MNRPHRSIEIFTMSALDLFITAMGSFAILMMILFPYYHRQRHPPVEEMLTGKLICAWPTRVRDFEAFAKAHAGRYGKDEALSGLGQDIWRRPGYEQQPDYPVVNVSLYESWEFCRWLTYTEREAGIIGPEDSYQLTTAEDWDRAVGPDKYPWGDQWPPPKDSGNFGDETWAKAQGRPRGEDVMMGYTDRHAGVAPVGSYQPSRTGLFDMAGNVKQLTTNGIRIYDADYRRGSSWREFGPRLESAAQELVPRTPERKAIPPSPAMTDIRAKADDTGFRIVLFIIRRERPPAIPREGPSSAPAAPAVPGAPAPAAPAAPPAAPAAAPAAPAP